jgi:hypothetical protein
MSQYSVARTGIPWVAENNKVTMNSRMWVDGQVGPGTCVNLQLRVISSCSRTTQGPMYLINGRP